MGAVSWHYGISAQANFSLTVNAAGDADFCDTEVLTLGVKIIGDELFLLGPRCHGVCVPGSLSWTEFFCGGWLARRGPCGKRWGRHSQHFGPFRPCLMQHARFDPGAQVFIRMAGPWLGTSCSCLGRCRCTVCGTRRSCSRHAGVPGCLVARVLLRVVLVSGVVLGIQELSLIVLASPPTAVPLCPRCPCMQACIDCQY